MATQQIRILHAFGRMGRGGAETWLMNVMRRIDRERFHFDFVVHRRRPGEFDDEIHTLGGAIYLAEHYRQPARYALELGSVLNRGGYHIAHSHVSHFSGYVLTLARALGVRGRIAHNHTAVPTTKDSRLRTAYKRAMRAAIHASCTRGLGASSKACESLYGPSWRKHDKYQVLLYGYDFSRFEVVSARTRAACRAELGVRDSDLVIGHIGRFVTPKNHEFIVELAAASKAAGLDHHRYVLVGDGERKLDIKLAIADRKLQDMIIMTGQRSDVPELLSGFDVMIQPSLWEGLGVSILEAQAAGVPCIISDRVPDEAMVIDGLVLRLPIDRAGSVRAWLQAIDRMQARPPISRRMALSRMKASEFDIDRHVSRLEAIYLEEAGC
jgi:glycosyltransferase involved in cell wall biosynthesis